MRTRTRLPLAGFVLAALAAVPAYAQGQDAWAEVSPEGEGFTVNMPGLPESSQQRLSAGELKAAGRRYEAAGAGGGVYVVLSLRDAESAGERLSAGGYRSQLFTRESPYLDAIAELAWEVFVRPEAKRLRNPRDVNPSLTFRREFELGGRPAREYLIELKKGSGPVYVCADGPRIYVVAAFGPGAQSAAQRQFVDSFALRPETPAQVQATPPPAANGVGVGPGEGGATTGTGGGAVDYSRPFRPGELTRRAQVISRPEPSYTESARKFGVTGTVSIRLVLGASGAVERVAIISGLPHELTRMAVAAARQIKFVPAEKDGRKVSQWVTIQYNFNIY